MSVEFNDESQQRKASLLYAQVQSTVQVSGIAQWLINKNIVKTSQQASAVQITFTIVCLVLSGVIAFKMFVPEKVYVSPEEQRIIDFNNNVGRNP